MKPRPMVAASSFLAVFLLLSCGKESASTPLTATQTVTRDRTAKPTVGAPTSVPIAAASSPSPAPVADPAELVAVSAKAALASWLGPVGDPASIEVRRMEAVTWPDGCLGLARVDHVCTLAQVEGFRVELTLANATYEVRTDGTASMVLWSPQVQILARFEEASANLIQFATDDGGTIIAQAVPGTDYGVEVALLGRGDPVSIALADAPQSGGLLLIWLDPAP